MHDPAIFAEGLTKVFPSRQRGPVTAVEALDLQIATGETYGLVGPDGAGKTTTLRLLAGLLRPTRGRSAVLGLDSAREGQARRLKARIGYMSQRANLYGDLTVRENLLLFARLQGVDTRRHRDRIATLLRFAGLEEITDRRGSQLSGGMRQKLALACVLVHEPEVVLLDEPTLGVDPASRREFWNLLARLRAERGLTILVCTAYMDEAERCHRIGLLYRGQLLAQGAPREIVARLTGEMLDFRPADLAQARALAAIAPGTIEVQTSGDRLRVFVDSAPQRAPELAAFLIGRGIEPGAMRQAQPGLEEAFVSLVLKRRAG